MLLKWALAFFILAVVTAVLGFGGIASGAASIAQILFYIFVAVFIISFVVGLFRR